MSVGALLIIKHLSYAILSFRGEGPGGGVKKEAISEGWGFSRGSGYRYGCFLGPHNWVAMHDDLLILRW